MFYIIKYTLLEHLRNKIYLSFLFLLLMISVISWLGSSINFNYGDFYISTFAFGMNLSELILIAFSLFLPVTHLNFELERGTAHVLWAKLHNRSSYYIGKYLAYLILILSLTVFSTLFIGLISYLQGTPLKNIIYLGYFIFFSFLEASCILSLALFLYSLLMNPILASFLGVLIIYFNIFLDTAKEISITSSNLLIKGIYFIMYLSMPNLSYFNVENHIIYQSRISVSYILFTSLYSLVFSIIMISLANIFFNRREL